LDYIGSKKKLNDWIYERVEAFVGDKDKSTVTFLDGCAGSGVVSRYYAEKGFRVVSNDLLAFTQHVVLGSTSLDDYEHAKAVSLAVRMNDLPGKEGFFFKHYSESSGRLYFTDDNAKRLDACREFIDIQENPRIRNYLLYCLLEAMSRACNSTGVQAAFLKKFQKTSKEPLVVKPERFLSSSRVEAFSMDVLKLLKERPYKVDEDILYIDPPYNHRQYAPNYHLYETLVKNDDPEITGVTGLRDWKEEAKSDFCSKKGCLTFLKDVLSATTAKQILISYNTDGLLSQTEVESALKELFPNAKHTTHKKEQKRYKSDKAGEKRKIREDALYELLFEVIR
jgi:adenine-specific DNA-methyltransferase